jgi:hypothetical protein
LNVADAGNGAELAVGGEKTMQNEMRQPLLEPYMLGDLQLRNRVVIAPLTPETTGQLLAQARSKRMFEDPNAGTLEFYRTRHVAETALTLRLFLFFASADLSYKPHVLDLTASARTVNLSCQKG